MSIEEYLDIPLGFIGGSYTPRQLIGWSADKEGVTHLDLKKPPALQSLKGLTLVRRRGGELKEFEIRRAIYQIGEWTMRAIDYVLERKKELADH